jgi:hypothetical protein
MAPAAGNGLCRSDHHPPKPEELDGSWQCPRCRAAAQRAPARPLPTDRPVAPRGENADQEGARTAPPDRRARPATASDPRAVDRPRQRSPGTDHGPAQRGGPMATGWTDGAHLVGGPTQARSETPGWPHSRTHRRSGLHLERHPASRPKPDSWPKVGVAPSQRSANGQLARLLAFRTQVAEPCGRSPLARHPGLGHQWKPGRRVRQVPANRFRYAAATALDSGSRSAVTSESASFQARAVPTMPSVTAFTCRFVAKRVNSDLLSS